MLGKTTVKYGLVAVLADETCREGNDVPKTVFHGGRGGRGGMDENEPGVNRDRQEAACCREQQTEQKT
jgi:hypothetical protein